MSKRKRELSLQQQRMLDALPKADSIAEAGRMAGYGTKQASQRAFQSIKRKAPQLLEEIGYGEKLALRKLVAMTDAKDTKFFAHQGRVKSQRTVADNETRLRARIELCRIHGCYPREVEVGGGVVVFLGSDGTIKLGRPGDGLHSVPQRESLPSIERKQTNGV